MPLSWKFQRIKENQGTYPADGKHSNMKIYFKITQESWTCVVILENHGANMKLLPSTSLEIPLCIPLNLTCFPYSQTEAVGNISSGTTKPWSNQNHAGVLRVVFLCQNGPAGIFFPFCMAACSLQHLFKCSAQLLSGCKEIIGSEGHQPDSLQNVCVAWHMNDIWVHK